jgi:tripeptidyl-peptidase-1
MLASAALAALLATASVDALPAGQRVELEPGLRYGATQSWEALRPSSSEDTIEVVIQLRHDAATLAALEQTFWAVSEPSSPSYGEHLTQAEIATRFGPVDGAADTVTSWLREAGVQTFKVSATGDMVEAAMSAPVAERLFATEIHAFRHTATGHTLNRAVKSYSLPAAVAAAVAVVGDLVALPAINTGIRVDEPAVSEPNAEWPTDCENGGLFKRCGSEIQKFVTPEVLNQRYNLGELPVVANGSMAVAEFQGVMWDEKDFELFEKTCGLHPGAVNVTTQIGRDAPITCRIPLIGSELCTEALLDIEYIKAVGGAIPLTDIFNSQFSLLKWMVQVSDLADPPLIHSVSYGNDEKQQTSAAFMDSANVQFQKAGARGLSVLFATGDQGVWGRSGSLGAKRFHPDFPAGSPYVTGVGGTDFAKTGTIGDETAWNDGGGGFSDTFASPSYQTQAVAGYLSRGSSVEDFPPASFFNATGRGYPDVSALAGVKNPYCVAAGGSLSGVGGTSAACPVVSAIFAK